MLNIDEIRAVTDKATPGEWKQSDDEIMCGGWCKYQVRTDWANDDDAKPHGGYVVRSEAETKRLDGRRKPGWFPVWVVRKGEWY